MQKYYSDEVIVISDSCSTETNQNDSFEELLESAWESSDEKDTPIKLLVNFMSDS